MYDPLKLLRICWSFRKIKHFEMICHTGTYIPVSFDVRGIRETANRKEMNK
jgi:hypothetical protein